MKARKFVLVLQEFPNEELSPREHEINKSVTICPQMGRFLWMDLLPASWALTRTDSQNKLTMCKLLLQWEKFACILWIPCQIKILTVLCDQVDPSHDHPPPLPTHTSKWGHDMLVLQACTVKILDRIMHCSLINLNRLRYLLTASQLVMRRILTATCLLESKY